MDLVGIVPGAGRASRIGGFFKELTPIAVSSADPSRFVVVCERIVALLRRAGASPIYLVVNSDKGVIPEYFNRSGLSASDSLYFAFQSDLDKFYGMPFAIDRIYQEARGKTVLLGMPDTLIEPDDAFEILLRRFQKNDADLELGIFRTQPGSYGGWVTFDGETSRVLGHVDKTVRTFPRGKSDNSWAIACWGPRFTQFMHDFVAGRRDEYMYTGLGEFRELLFGDVIDAALTDRSLVVTASYISEDRGYYLDITEPAKYFQAVLHYHTSRPSIMADTALGGPARAAQPQVFISHSSKQRAMADDLHQMLTQEGYRPVLDSYDIKPGEQIPKSIQALITKSDYFVLLLSQDSLDSNWVQAEVALAFAAGMVDRECVLPVQVGPISDDVANTVLFIPRNTYNWLDGSRGLRAVLKWLDEQEAHSAGGNPALR